MNLMFSYSGAVADRRLGHPPVVDSMRRTSQKLVGPYLPRPLTSPSCGAPRHLAPALTAVGCERVSGTRMDTLVDDLGNIEKKIMNSKTKQIIVYGVGEGYPSTGAAAGSKAGPAASSSSNRGRPGVGRHTPGRALASSEEDLGASRGGTPLRRRGGGGVGSADDETPLCSPSPAAAGTLGKRPYRRITGIAEGAVLAAFAANGRDGDAGRLTRWRDTSAGDSDSAWLPAPGKRMKRGARRGVNTDTDTDAEAAIVVAAAAANHGGADGSDMARSDVAGTGSVEEHATRESAKPPHGQEEEEGAYLRRRVHLLEREVSRLRETVERLTSERTAEGPKS